MDVCEFDSYKALIQARLLAMPRKGRGQGQKIAGRLRMHTSRWSRVLKGDENLTLEQASDLAHYLGFGDFETDYFLALVNLERAGSEALRKLLRRQIAGLRAQAKKLEKRLATDRAFTDEEQALFYSQWYYSGVRLLTSIPGNDNVDRIAERLGLPKRTVARVLDFLLAKGLCVKKDGRLCMGPQRTHLPSDSPMVARLHANWRMKAIERAPNLSDEELALTAPMSIRREDFPKIRAILVEAIEKSVRIAAESPQAETLACLNVDFFNL